MAEYQRCPRCTHSEIRAVGVDCPICFKEQRAKMQSAGNAYMLQKAQESLESRRAPFHMYRNYTRNVATANSHQDSDERIYAHRNLPLLRNSGLTKRIINNENFSTQRMKPLQKAGAICLCPLESLPTSSQPIKADETEVFFDDEPRRESKYVFLNGDIYRGKEPLPEDRVIYGIDSPMASVHSAVREAVKPSASTKVLPSEEAHAADSPTDRTKRSRSASRRSNLGGEEERTDKVPSGSYRNFFSLSGRCYRVIEVGRTAPKPSAKKANQQSFLPEAVRRSEAARDGEQQGQRTSHRSSGHSRNAPHSEKGKAKEYDKRVSNDPNDKPKIVPQKPTKTRDGRRQSRRRDEGRKDTRRISPTREKQFSRRSPSRFDDADDNERLPPISRDRYWRNRSPSFQHVRKHSSDNAGRRGGEVNSRNDEHKRRHPDSMDSADALSPYSRSHRDDDFVPSKSGNRSGRESDCVVTDGSGRPRNRPRKRRVGRKQRGRRHSPSLSSGSSGKDVYNDRRRAARHGRDRESDTDSEWSEVAEDFLWSMVRSDSALSSSTLSSTSDGSSTSSSSTEHERSRGQRHRRGGRGRRSSFSSSASASNSDKAVRRSHHPKRNSGHHASDKSKRTKNARPSPRLSSSASISQSASTSIPTHRPESGVDRPHQSGSLSPLLPHDSRSSSPPRPPVVHAVRPPLPTGLLPPFTEEMIPSTRYEPACPSPVAHMPQPPLSEVTAAEQANEKEEKTAAGGTDGCISRETRQPWTAEEVASAANPLRRAYEEIPAEPLLLTHFNDLRRPSITSSLPVCSPSNAPQTLPPREHDSVLPALPSGAPYDLDSIAAYVLRVICDRLGGEGTRYGGLPGPPLPPQETEAAHAASTAEKEAEEQRLAQEKAAAAQRRRAELLRLHQLLREVQEELRYFQEAKMPLDSLTSSLKFASAQVSEFAENDAMRSDLDESATSPKFPGNIVADSSTLVYVDGEQKLPRLSKGGHDANVSDLEVDMATLERLLKELRDRRTKHEARLRELEVAAAAKAAAAKEAAAAAEEEERRKSKEEAEQRQRKAVEEEAAARALQAQQQMQEVAALVAQEANTRTIIAREEKFTYDQLVAYAATSQDESRRRAIAAQEARFDNECTDLLEAELDARANIAAMAAEEAEDFWDVAAQLWQAAAEEAEEAAAAEEAKAEAERERLEQEAATEAEQAARRKSAAWQAAQAEEEARLQAEILEIEAAAANAARQRQESQESHGTEKKGNRKWSMPRTSIKGRRVQSNLIPGQILDVSEESGKIRLVGDPHIEAVVARMRERRRADRMRQERLASAMLRSPVTKPGRSPRVAGPPPSNREPSTVRISVAGNGVAPQVRKSGQGASRATSRRSVTSSRSRNSVGAGNGRLDQADRGEIPPSRGRLQSESSFVADAALDLEVEGQHVGTPYKTRSRASSIASAGVPHMGGVFTAATPHKSRFPDDETDALTSSNILEVE
ncbi:hypothetical protein ABB37_07392 [Leptomonas pyrrhocoris]|uniref:Uncharacterized protein n=1 Tax=Leptomonas pyrrhocoris TaxID=157538 RepID=A0A0N0DTG6_LEPPY|nr:hypothetical protein ABB37_07392 [Leptomonas pyrrhocoris]KPA77054.1 hypothetical protein ABB37_07392 [Leptomonas pyrrhocoris]|eukprot:XP_015655493.1 hypothetical protein ABB37_07392 [Leptomonas pyrrhocoris]